MTQMPQLVALFNGVGGGAAALVALLELHESQIASDGWFSYLPGVSEGPATPLTALLAIAFTVLVGSVSFSGSVITFLKLQEVMTTRPVILPGMQFLMIGVLTGSVVLAIWLVGGAELGVAALLGVAGLLTRSAGLTCRS
jgi:NAD(P) transhydrogenase subunit beta